MRMAGRVLSCCVALFLTLTTVSAFQKLNSISDLRKISFGKSVPRHSLLLLHWFANVVDIDGNNVMHLTFNPDSEDYGSHHYGNFDELLDPLPYRHRYFTVGNLNPNTAQQLPDYVINPPADYAGTNSDRIVFRVREQNTLSPTIDRVYLTQHYGIYGSENYRRYDPAYTYEITTNLLREIRQFSVEENQPLWDLRNRFGSNASDFQLEDIRNTCGYLACLGLLLFIVIQEGKMRMAGRVTSCCVALFLTLTTVSALQQLNSINDLRNINFGQSVPRHSLLLLHWFANALDIDGNNVMHLTFNPDSEDYGSHHYGNFEGLLEQRPHGHQYYTIGNLNQDSPRQLPDYVLHPRLEFREGNRDRIIIRVRQQNRGAFQQLNSISDLKKVSFGQSVPKHSLLLLHWFANALDIDRNNVMHLTFNPNSEDYGSHYYSNFQGIFEQRPLGHQYYTIGNLYRDSARQLPSYVRHPRKEYREGNRDRIIIRVRQQNRGGQYWRIDRVYLTQHSEYQGTYDPAYTYEITTNLLREIRQFSVEENQPLEDLRDRFGRNVSDFQLRNIGEKWGALLVLDCYYLLMARMVGRLLSCCAALFLTLTTVSAFQKLNSINDLKKINFGQSVPGHSLLLLHWFANTIDIDNNDVIHLTFDPNNGDYGSHHYGNYERLLDPLPQGNIRYRYYTVGNLNQNSPMGLPSYVIYPQAEYVGRNRDRIIFRVREQNTGGLNLPRIDRVYLTQHYETYENQGTRYDPDHTYQVTTNLLREITQFSVGADQQSLSDLRDRFGSHADSSELRNIKHKWGNLACLGLLLFIVIQEKNFFSQNKRPQRASRRNVQPDVVVNIPENRENYTSVDISRIFARYHLNEDRDEPQLQVTTSENGTARIVWRNISEHRLRNGVMVVLFKNNEDQEASSTYKFIKNRESGSWDTSVPLNEGLQVRLHKVRIQCFFWRRVGEEICRGPEFKNPEAVNIAGYNAKLQLFGKDGKACARLYVKKNFREWRSEFNKSWVGFYTSADKATRILETGAEDSCASILLGGAGGSWGRVMLISARLFVELEMELEELSRAELRLLRLTSGRFRPKRAMPALATSRQAKGSGVEDGRAAERGKGEAQPEDEDAEEEEEKEWEERDDRGN
ncbi:hypothetical protein INR49_011165, partial [Caranx melampygus]